VRSPSAASAPVPPPRLALRGVALRRGGREVLRDVSLAVAPGEIFGLLGPNGAGKSTLFEILAGLLRPDAGAFLLDGEAIAPGARALRARAGIVFQEPGLDGKLTAEENLRLAAALHRVPRAAARERIARLLSEAGLAGRAREPVERLSGGMRRRLELARALVHAPSLLVMDEPTTGLDAGAFRAFWERIALLRRAEGTTVVVTTHRPDEAERCDRLGVLAGGAVVACETPDALRARVAGDVIVVDGDDREALASAIAERLGLDARVRPDGVHVSRAEGHALVPRIVEAFPAGRLRSVSLRRPTLADAYLAVTGLTLDGEAALAPPPPPPTTTSTATATPTPRASTLRPAHSPLAYDLATALVLARRDLVRFFRQPTRLAGALGQPLLFWLVIGGGLSGTFRIPGADVSYLAYFFPGVVLMIVLFASIFTTASVIEDRHRGFLQSVQAGPGSRAALVLGKTLGSAAVALSQAALFVALAPLAGFPYGGVDWPLLAAALLLAAVALAALGFAVAWGLDDVPAYHAVQMMVLVPLWVVSGAMFPAPAGHPGFAAAMRANPVAYAVSAARRALGGDGAPGVLPGSAARDLAVCAAFAAAALALAVLASRRPART
jgi:ABC-2 type transport system ATP-binding protein